MAIVTRLLLDVLKPHQPNALSFASAIADECADCKVSLTVVERDEKTETTLLCVEGRSLSLDSIKSVVSRLGGSVHSVDEVEVTSGQDDEMETD